MQKNSLDVFHSFSKKILIIFLGITLFAIFVPLLPSMPKGGLDPSWQYAINEAVAQGLVFGKDIIFTFGPYCSVYTKLYHPGTDHLMLLGGVYFAFCYFCLLIFFLAENIPLKWLFIFTLFLVTLSASQDALFFSYDLILALVVYRFTLPANEKMSLALSSKKIFFLLFLFSPLGFLPLIKASFAILSLAIIVLCSLMFLNTHKKWMIPWAIIFPIVSFMLFWHLAHQPLNAIPDFFINAIPIISGYGEAMAYPGSKLEMIAYMFSSGLILFFILTRKEIPIASKLFLLLATSLFLFITFKEGFIRHDSHALAASNALIFTAILLRFVILPDKFFGLLFLCSFITGIYIFQNYLPISSTTIFANAKTIYQNSYQGLKIRTTEKNKLKNNFYTSLQTIHQSFPLPVFKGTVDIYPYDQSYLLASGNKWAPRPVLQSYSAYTPYLAKLDADYLASDKAPDYIIFNIQPIDERFPALGDAPSWPILFYRYNLLYSISPTYVVLKKKENHFNYPPQTLLLEKNYRLKETVTLPLTTNPVFAQIIFKPTLLGRVVSLFYKPQSLMITFTMDNGMLLIYDIIPNMSKTGFWLSPFIETTADFGALFHKNTYLKLGKVKTIQISPKWKDRHLWKETYTLRLTTFPLSQKHFESSPLSKENENTFSPVIKRKEN